MRDIPECMNRRYDALDELIRELTSSISCHSSEMEYSSEPKNDVGIKLLCDFWNILKENPDYNLTRAVKERMGIAAASNACIHPQRVTCYMAGREGQDDSENKKREALNKVKKLCCAGSGGTEPAPTTKCCASKSVSPSIGSDVLPLSKVLCNLKEAASFDKKCNARINDLMLAQKELKDQIQHLEHREKEGMQLLKQADCMWSCMEDTYKKKVAESLERQKGLLKQLKEVETSATKWRKNKKDLEFQLDGINKCQQEIREKSHQKTNDVKCMNMEIGDFKKRIENNKKDTEAAKKSLGTKKKASNARIAKLAAELLKQQKILADENEHKQSKEKEGSKYVKEAREDLQKICTVLLQKKIKNEDLKAEKDALNVEIEFLRQTCDNCKEKCKNKQQSINDEIKTIDKEIAEFKIKCIRCHQCTDTMDVRKLCTDCPRCSEERDCLYEDEHCSPNHSIDCVCMSVKQKFLDNVFDNMYTVLERQTKMNPGKCVAEAVFNCLKRSRNGKLNDETRKILQEFILTTVKKNLNLTIVGGAVKTRCEMDPETYKQLMLCLKLVKTVRPPKEDKGTAAKKESCRRWGGSSECNCPKGPKACICTKKAPPPPQDPTPCPPPDKEDAVEAIACPHRESIACGPDCAMHAVPSRVGTDVAAWRPDPCKESSCPFTKNMRAAQCVLGPESLCSLPKGFVPSVPYVPDLSSFNEMVVCKCGSSPTKPCICRDKRCRPREIIIEEVMGRYVEVSPIDKVTVVDELCSKDSHIGRHINTDCLNSIPIKYLWSSDTNTFQTCSSNFISSIATGPVTNALTNRNQVLIYNDSKHNSCSNTKEIVRLFPNGDHTYSRNTLQGDEVRTGIAVIQTPRSCDRKFREVRDINEFASCIDENPSGNNFRKNTNGYFQSKDARFLERNVRETVKDLVKNIVVFDVKAKNKQNAPNIEWLTVESFIKEITALTKISTDDVSEMTAYEIEVKAEELENTSKIFNADVQMKNYSTDNFITNKSLNNLRHSEYDKNIDEYIENLYGSNEIHVENLPIVPQNSLIDEESKDTKQLKAGLSKQIHKDTSVGIYDKVNNQDISQRYSLVKKVIRKESYAQCVPLERFNLKNVPSVQADTFSDHIFLQEPTKLYDDNTSMLCPNDLEQNKIKDQLNTVIDKVNVQLNNQLVELTNTASGDLAIELDEKVINTIERKMKEDPNINIIAKKIDSGHFVLDLNTDQNILMNNQKITMKQTPSGTKLFKINRDFVSEFKHNNTQNQNNNELDLNQTNVHDILESITDVKTVDCHSKSVRISQSNTVVNILNKRKKDLIDLKDLCCLKDVAVRILGQNGMSKDIEAPVTRTLSGNIAIDVQNISSFGEISFTSKEYPVILEKTSSNKLLLDISKDDKPNAILRRTSSGGILLIDTRPVLSSVDTVKKIQEKDTFLKVKIKDIKNHIKEPPAVLHLTPSNNYVIVLDKEYEKIYLQNINDNIDENSECLVELHRTASDYFMIAFDNRDDLSENGRKNALLVKSQSGHIKVLVNGTIFDSMKRSMLRRTSKSSAKAYETLLKKLPDSNKDIHIDKLMKSILHNAKSSSDSHIYDKDKMKLSDQKGFIVDQMATFKKTTSGHYAMVLNKESKTAFVKNLKNYLKESRGLIPIKRAESGEITIVLNSEDRTKTGYGSLKITPSGNIYVVVDEKAIQDDAKSSVTSKINTRSKHVIGQIKKPVNKSVTTSCNAQPGSCSCDSSKCVCSDLEDETQKWLQNSTIKDGVKLFQHQNCSIDWKKEKRNKHNGYRVCEPDKCQEKCAMNTQSGNSEKSPHIVIKPNECRSMIEKTPKSKECYLMAEAICPFHVDRYESVSNELLEISRLCNKMRKTTKGNDAREDCEKYQDNWDSLSYLPPQLPGFLNSYKYR